MSAYNLADMIKSELMKLPEDNRKESGANMVIVCPFHAENTPSFNVNVDPVNRKVALGWGYCFGCGASKPWNEIAAKLGLAKIGKDGEKKAAATVRKSDPRIKEKLLGKKEGMDFVQLCDFMQCRIPQEMEDADKWRGFKGKFLKKIGAQIAVDDYDNKVLVLPVYVDGVLEGGIKAMWKKPKSKKVPKYQNMKGEWSKTHGLFPYDYVDKMIRKKKKKYVVLVEGPRDALRLVKYGVPALCILGTHTWSKNKRNLVLQLGINKVVVCMDGDSAGIKATNDIMKDLKHKTTRQRIKMKEWNDKYAKKYNEGKSFDIGDAPRKVLRKLIAEFEKSE